MSFTASNNLDLHEVGAIYSGFMDEAKIRLKGVETALTRIGEAGHSEGAFLDAEFCYLQLRMTCEIIALAALVAHNELPEAKTQVMLGKWNADDIFDRLSKVNRHCFPVPLKEGTTESGHRHLEPLENPPLTRRGLKRLYHGCGANLHRGVLKHVYGGKRRTYDIAQIREWAWSIHRLLDLHAVMLPKLNAVLLVQMSDERGAVQCSRLQGINGDRFNVRF